VRLPAYLEFSAPAPERLLAWLIRNPGELDDARISAPNAGTTAEKRRRLKSGDPEVVREGLDALLVSGSSAALREWWAFEGPTSIDCYLETDEFVFAIEGKRTERLASSTSWLPERNQLARNLEVVQSLACGRRYGVIMVVERLTDFAYVESQALLDYVSPARPHFHEYEREFLARHFLGVLTWQELCDAADIKYDTLPHTAVDFYRQYASLVVR
jgi:hypothetical protein